MRETDGGGGREGLGSGWPARGAEGGMKLIAFHLHRRRRAPIFGHGYCRVERANNVSMNSNVGRASKHLQDEDTDTVLVGFCDYHIL